MKKLVIVSERTRGHFQDGVNRLEKFDVIHFYRHTFSDMVIDPRNRDFVKYSSVFNLYRRLKCAKPDLIQPLEPYYGYSRFGFPLRVVPIMLTVYIYCLLNRVPYFIHFLENLPPQVKYPAVARPFMKALARMLVKRARMLFYVNDGAKKNIAALGGQSKAHFGLWGIWGVDLERFKPSVKPVKNKVLFVGRLSRHKGVYDLLQAFKIVAGQISEAKLELVGSFEDEANLREKIKDLGLGNHTKIIGEVPDKQIANYFKSASLLAFPSRTSKFNAEQVGMSAIEAMASGLPVVAYDSGSIGEFVKDGKSGFLVKEGDTRSLAGAILKLLTDDNLHRKMSKGAVDLAKDKFDQKKNVRELEKILEENFAQ